MVSPLKDAQPSHRIVVNEFRLVKGRRACTFPTPGVGRFTAVWLSACTVREPTYWAETVVLLERAFWTARFHTSLYSTLKSWFTPFTPIAPLGLKVKILFIASVGVPGVLVTTLFRKNGIFSARF